MESLKCELQKHRTTRKILSALKRPSSKQQGGAQENRKVLELQRRLTAAVSRYGTAIEAAFEALLAAIEGLEQGGLREVEAIVPFADGLVKGLYESHAIVKNVVRAMSVPLEVHSVAVAACIADIAKADHNSSELRRYQLKVGALAEETEHKGEQKKEQAEVRLQRNRGKLDTAEREASEAEAKAEASLAACLAKQASLEETVQGAILGTIEALHAAVSHLPGAVGKPAASPASTPPAPPQPLDTVRWRRGAAQSSAPPPVPPPPHVGSLNPFDCDILDASREDVNLLDIRSPPTQGSETEGRREAEGHHNTQALGDSPGEGNKVGNEVDVGWNPFEDDIQEEDPPPQHSGSSQAPAEPALPTAPSAQSFHTHSTVGASSQAGGSPHFGALEARP